MLQLSPLPNFPRQILCLFIHPLSSPCPKAPSGGSATLQSSSFFRLASLQRKPPCSPDADGSGEQGGWGGICSAHPCRSRHVAPQPCLSHHPLLSLAIAAKALTRGDAFGVAWPWWCRVGRKQPGLPGGQGGKGITCISIK